MTTYKGIRGLTIRTVAGDPSPLVDGDIWYDSVAKKVQGAKTGAGSWASGGNLPGNYFLASGFGSQTAGVIAGGEVDGSSSAEAFHYDGSAWTAGGNLNTHRNVAGAYGTQTAGALVGGHAPPIPTGVSANHETYDASSWSEAGDLNTGRGYLAVAKIGTTTAALAISGLINTELDPSPFGAVGFKTESEEYNGTSWAEGNDLSVGRQYISGAGTQTAALGIGGDAGPAVVDVVESYDGTSWTEVNNLNTARRASSAGGSQTLALNAGGPGVAIVEQWDGSSWTEVADMSTARGTSSSGFAAEIADGFVGGGTPPSTAVTEEWTLASAAVTFTSS